MGDRVVDCARLESVCAPKRHRGFESLPIRQLEERTQCFARSRLLVRDHAMEIRTPFDRWGASRARVKSEAHLPEPKRSFG